MGEGSGKSFREERILENLKNVFNFAYSKEREESEEELKSLLMNVREESGIAGLKLNILKLRSWPHYFMSNRRGNDGSSDRFPLLGLQNHCRKFLQP